jgi:4-alpha-glucanotransferase
VLAIHDASFPSRADEDTGRGSPYSRGARDLLAWAQDLGFDAVQLGPQGETSATNPSPYDGTAFAKTILSASLWHLAHAPEWEGILDRAVFEDIVLGAPPDGRRMAYDYVFAQHRRAMREAHARLDRMGDLFRRFDAWRRANASWLDRDSRYESLAAEYGTDDWRGWPKALAGVKGDEVFELGQFVVHAQHAELVAHAEASGLRLYGDLAIGTSHRDRFGRDRLFLERYVMGAPPSRTNPEGQPWGYPVLVPGSAEGLVLVRARATKLLSEFHGIRIDHPHGHVCPWVYDAQSPDPLRAVKQGARLFESPDLPDHPDLAQWAIARPEQIDRHVSRHADGWVRALDEEQVDRYARQIEILMEAARAFGRSEQDVLLEVLSTCPYPLLRVMQRYGLGRFRVTQKTNPRDPTDVYSTEQARPGDWVMLGNHDTPPIWTCVDGWSEDKQAAWRAYLEGRLGADVFAGGTTIPQAMLADLFACPAGRVSVFFADLLGEREVYNTPGVVSADNWTLRAERDFARVHAERIGRGLALDVPRALATALRARGHDALAARLDAHGGRVPR